MPRTENSKGNWPTIRSSDGRPRPTERRVAAATGIATIAALGIAALPDVATAAAPDRVSVDISETFTDDSLTEACGTTVTGTAQGTVEITLWRNAAGLVVRELDRFPAATFTWTAPETGRSVKTRYDVTSNWDYGDGAVQGGPVTITAHGLFFHIPGGTSAGAGKEVAVGDVDFFEDGLPIVQDATTVSFVGHSPDFDFVAEICKALTG